MKRCIALFAAFALSIGFLPPSHAQSGGMSHDKGADVQASQAHKASGTVTRVDPANSKVTVAHGPVQSLKWPPMTMNFVVKDKALLDKLSAGKKIEFQFVQQGRDYVITSAK